MLIIKLLRLFKGRLNSILSNSDTAPIRDNIKTPLSDFEQRRSCIENEDSLFNLFGDSGGSVLVAGDHDVHAIERTVADHAGGIVVGHRDNVVIRL